MSMSTSTKAAVAVAVVGGVAATAYYLSSHRNYKNDDVNGNENSSSETKKTSTVTFADDAPTAAATAAATATNGDGDCVVSVERASALKSEGNALFNANKYDTAILKYSEAIAASPSSSKDVSKFYGNRAACYQKLKKYENVIADCTHALDIDSKYVKARKRRATAYEAMGHINEAVEDTLLASADEPAMQAEVERLVDILGDKKAAEKLKEKIGAFPSKGLMEIFMRTLKEDPYATVDPLPELPTGEPPADSDAESLFSRGMAQLCHCEYSLAMRSFSDAVNVSNRTHGGALMQLGTLQHVCGYVEESLLSLRTALTVLPVEEHYNAYVRLGNVLLIRNAGDPAEALEAYLKAVELNPNSTLPHYHIGQAYNHINKFDLAKKAYQDLLKVDSCHYDALNQLGLSYMYAGDTGGEAKEYFQRAIEVFPNRSEAYNNLGLFHQGQRDVAKAMHQFTRAMKKDPKSAAAYSNKATLLFETEQNAEEALVWYNKAIEVDDTCIEAFVQMGMVKLSTNQIDEAVTLFDSAIELSPVEADLKTIYRFREAALLRKKLLSKGVISLEEM